VRVTIRVASPGDGATLAALFQHVHGLHVAARPDFFRAAPLDEAAEWLVSLMEGPRSRIWIAESDGRPIGYILAYFHEQIGRRFSHPRRWCEIDQIAVVPDQRRRGVARALAQAVLDEARGRDIRDIELSSWSFNVEAHEAFRRLGFTPKVIRFELMLEKGA
jgi:GNAT superfamily N-acetyltransferase